MVSHRVLESALDPQVSVAFVDFIVLSCGVRCIVGRLSGELVGFLVFSCGVRYPW